jgi:hypothetical protein
VTKAKNAAEANLIARCAEPTAARNQTDTSKNLEANPSPMRLRDLEVLETLPKRSLPREAELPQAEPGQAHADRGQVHPHSYRTLNIAGTKEAEDGHSHHETRCHGDCKNQEFLSHGSLPGIPD